MPAKRYRVNLTQDKREQLLGIVRRGKSSARKVKRSLILCKADEGLTDQQIAGALLASPSTVVRARQRFTEEGLERALNERARSGKKRKLDGKQEAHLVAVACTPAPEGRTHWTLQLLADKVVKLELAESISPETARQVLKKNELKPWQKKEWCIPEVSADFVACMEDVLHLYAEPYDPKRPVVNFDKTSKQLVAEKKTPRLSDTDPAVQSLEDK